MTARLLTIIVLAAVDMAMPALAQDRPFACDGPFGKEASHASLARAFGAGNVVFRTIDGPEGSTLKATVLFDKDKSRRLEVLWHDEKGRRRPSMISAGEGSRWRTADGLGVGSSLVDVERANGKPFTMSGFDWDYGGTVLDWENGKLAEKDGGCRLIVRFEPTDNALAQAREAVTGDKDISSADGNMRAVKPTVYEIGLSYPE